MQDNWLWQTVAVNKVLKDSRSVGNLSRDDADQHSIQAVLGSFRYKDASQGIDL
jgi:hypothetical protein